MGRDRKRTILSCSMSLSPSSSERSVPVDKVHMWLRVWPFNAIITPNPVQTCGSYSDLSGPLPTACHWEPSWRGTRWSEAGRRLPGGRGREQGGRGGAAWARAYKQPLGRGLQGWKDFTPLVGLAGSFDMPEQQ